jgi:hypothetical protein
MDYLKLTSPCGIDCFNCEIYESNVTAELQQAIGQRMQRDPKEVKCQGCRVSGCFILPKGCKARACAAAKGVEFCFECDQFPCRMLQPCLDGAEKYPQNFKLYNLCRIQRVGLETWARDEAATVRALYKKGKIEVGAGPKLVEKGSKI